MRVASMHASIFPNADRTSHFHSLRSNEESGTISEDGKNGCPSSLVVGIVSLRGSKAIGVKMGESEEEEGRLATTLRWLSRW